MKNSGVYDKETAPGVVFPVDTRRPESRHQDWANRRFDWVNPSTACLCGFEYASKGLKR